MSRIIIIEDEMANIFIYKVEIVTKKKADVICQVRMEQRVQSPLCTTTLCQEDGRRSTSWVSLFVLYVCVRTRG